MTLMYGKKYSFSATWGSLLNNKPSKINSLVKWCANVVVVVVVVWARCFAITNTCSCLEVPAALDVMKGCVSHAQSTGVLLLDPIQMMCALCNSSAISNAKKKGKCIYVYIVYSVYISSYIHIYYIYNMIYTHYIWRCMTKRALPPSTAPGFHLIGGLLV